MKFTDKLIKNICKAAILLGFLVFSDFSVASGEIEEKRPIATIRVLCSFEQRGTEVTCVRFYKGDTVSDYFRDIFPELLPINCEGMATEEESSLLAEDARVKHLRHVAAVKSGIPYSHLRITTVDDTNLDDSISIGTPGIAWNSLVGKKNDDECVEISREFMGQISQAMEERKRQIEAELLRINNEITTLIKLTLSTGCQQEKLSTIQSLFR